MFIIKIILPIQIIVISSLDLNSTDEEDIVCIRHGRSQFNQGQIQFFNINTHLQYPQAQDDKVLRDSVLFSPKYVDSPLSKQGIEQCMKQRQNPKLSQVKLVLVSPLLRALQTAKIIFQSKKIPFIVLPQLTEAFRYGCDLCSHLNEKKEKFPEMDFNHMKHFGNHWYIQHLLNEKNKKVFDQIMHEHPQLSLNQKHQVICSLVATKQLYENSEELRMRVNRVKRILQQYRKSYDKIAVGSHSWTLRYLLTTKFDQNNYPIHLPTVQNATPIWVCLKKLLAHL